LKKNAGFQVIREVLFYYHKPVVESTIIPVALVTEPATIPGSSGDGTFNFILNISSPSTILSVITGTFTVVVFALAGNVAVRWAELKSVPPVKL